LEDFLQTWGVPGLQGIDTRALVRRLRDTGTQRGVLRHAPPAGFTGAELDSLRVAAKAAPSVSQLDLVTDVSNVLPRATSMDEIAVIDLGAKWNILRSLERRGVAPRVWDWSASAEEVLEAKPKGILVSNGPGDPAKLQSVVDTLRTLVGSGTPL